MTNKQAVENWEAGHPVFKARYLMSIAETISWRDKDTKSRLSAPVLRHTVLMSTGAVTVNEDLPEDAKPEAYVSPFKDGERVLVNVRSYLATKGQIAIRGSLEKITAA